MTPSSPEQRSDAFPSTRVTWLGKRLEEGEEGLAAAREHVMRVYAEPLTIYLRGSSFRGLDEDDELVQGFFASRLSRASFLHDWAESGRPLRRWLLTGFRHYLHERVREHRRFAAPPVEATAQAEPAPAALFNRHVALSVVREAMAMAEKRCRGEGFERHWMIFRLHTIDGLPYDDLPTEFREPPRRAATMARTASNRFRAALRELVGWPGASDEAVDREIHALMRELEL